MGKTNKHPHQHPRSTSENRSSLPPGAKTTNSISVLTDTPLPQRAHPPGAAVSAAPVSHQSQDCKYRRGHEELAQRNAYGHVAS